MNTSTDDIKKTLCERGICVLIPTYNNGGTIGRVVREVQVYCKDVIVVNDGSTDDTSAILHGIGGISLVEYRENRGKGYALKQGFKKALAMGFSFAITLDGDGQHYAASIADLLRANQEHPKALIVGSRRLDGVDRSGGSSFANKFSNFWFWVQTGRRLPDTQTGCRLYPLKNLPGWRLLTSRYEAELELLVFASWHGVELVSVPIDVYYPPREERVSHFRPVRDFARISVLNTVLCLLAVIYGLPLRLLRWLEKCVRTLYTLLMFILIMMGIITPSVWVYLKIAQWRIRREEKRGRKKESERMKEDVRRNMRRVIHRFARFVMLSHGIPGTRFSYKVASADCFDKPHVVVCNHQSHLDLMCMLIFTPNIVFLTNDWVWRNPFYGLVIRNAGYCPVANGMEEMMPRLRQLAEQGCSIAVFPEGTRSKTCRIGRFHQGAFYLAQQLNLDVLPMCLYGPGKVLPKGKHSLNRGPIHIEVGEPIPQQRLADIGGTREQASYMRKLYINKYEAMANRFER